MDNFLFYMDNLAITVGNHLITRGLDVSIIFTTFIFYNTFLLSTASSFFSTLTVKLPVLE